MEKLGIIVGSGLYNSEWIKGLPDETTNPCSPYMKRCEGTFILQRHGAMYYHPPHEIDHEENLRTLKSKGIEKIIGICSVGSLRPNIKPGAFCIPTDYIDFWSRATIYNGENAKHIVPDLDADLCLHMIDCLPDEAIFKGECIYVQTTGPRLETKAEITVLKTFAHIVGMTMGSEATIAKELGMKYAALCMVDNYANGIKGTITAEEIGRHAKESTSKIEKFIKKICGYEHTD